MQRPLGSQTPTRPPSQQPNHPSSPFASHQRPSAPPGMNATQQSASSTNNIGSPAGLPGGVSTGIPGGPGSRSGVLAGFPSGGLPSPAAGRSMGPGGAGGYTARSAGGTGPAGAGAGANNFVFGNAGAGYGQGHTHPGPGNIDLADFPALGSGVGAGGLGGASQTPAGLANVLGGAASRAAVAAAAAGSVAASGGGAGGGGAGNFNTDDFPALGAPTAPGGNGQPTYANGSQAQAAVAAAAAAAAAEQASAAAALQHQASQREAHRLGLLVNGSPQVSNQGPSIQGQALNAARGGFGEMDRNYATKLGSAQASGLPALSTSTGGAQSWSQSGDASGAHTNGISSQSAGPRATTTPASQILFSPADRFGLAGLLRIIKLQAAGPGAGGANGANPEDVGMLALGSDLQTLGLDVASDHPLHPDFHTPWSSDAHPLQRSQRSMVEPEFHLPSCYNVQPPPPAQTKVANFSDETLFFIFYSTPRDILQEVAAVELHHRNWRFHKELQLWLTKEHNMEPTQKTPMYEKGQYVFWDVESWQRVTKNFVLLYELLEDRPALAVQAQAQALQQQQQQQGGNNAPTTPSQPQASSVSNAGQAQPAGR